MPEIMPAKGDIVAVGNLTAEIGSKTPGGDYEVVLSSEPMFRAVIKIADYDWSHESRQWIRRMVPASDGPAAPARLVPRAVVDLPE